jgi:hypothetical protein
MPRKHVIRSGIMIAGLLGLTFIAGPARAAIISGTFSGVATTATGPGNALVPYDLVPGTFRIEIPSYHLRNEDAFGQPAKRGGGGATDSGEVIPIGSGYSLDHADIAQASQLA